MLLSAILPTLVAVCAENCALTVYIGTIGCWWGFLCLGGRVVRRWPSGDRQPPAECFLCPFSCLFVRVVVDEAPLRDIAATTTLLSEVR